jgi:hypothetical protein
VINTLGVIGVAATSFMITDAVLNSANTIVNEAKARQSTSATDIHFGFAEEYAAAKTDEERAAIKKRAQFNLGQDEASRGVTDKLFGNSDVYLKSMQGLEDVARQIDEARAKGTDAQQYQQATGQSTLVTDISVAIARELTGALTKTLSVKVTNPDEFTSLNTEHVTMAPSPMRY